jgi:hypothetical protein
MWTALATIVAGIAGLVIGYMIRLNEFRRDRRLIAYSEFIGAFLAAAHAGAALFSAGIQQGDRFWAEENHTLNSELWRAFGSASQGFESATARLRLVGSSAARIDSEVIEDFITQNIRNVEPLNRGTGVSAGGSAAKVGPAEVDRQAVRLARHFADRSHGEMTRWRPPREVRPPLGSTS